MNDWNSTRESRQKSEGNQIQNNGVAGLMPFAVLLEQRFHSDPERKVSFFTLFTLIGQIESYGLDLDF
jgi:hypothetical protein